MGDWRIGEGFYSRHANCCSHWSLQRTGGTILGWVFLNKYPSNIRIELCCTISKMPTLSIDVDDLAWRFVSFTQFCTSGKTGLPIYINAYTIFFLCLSYSIFFILSIRSGKQHWEPHWYTLIVHFLYHWHFLHLYQIYVPKVFVNSRLIIFVLQYEFLKCDRVPDF